MNLFVIGDDFIDFFFGANSFGDQLWMKLQNH